MLLQHHPGSAAVPGELFERKVERHESAAGDTVTDAATADTASGTADAVALPATSIGPCFRVRRAARATRFATQAGAKRMTSGSAQITYNRATDR